MSGMCKGTPIQKDETLPSVGIALNLEKILEPYLRPLAIIAGQPIPTTFQVSGSKGSSLKCCEAKREVVMNDSVSFSGTVGTSFEFPVPGASFPIPPRFGKLGVFVTLGLASNVGFSFEEDKCEDKNFGRLAGKVGFKITGALKFETPGEFANVTGGISSGLEGGFVSSVQSTKNFDNSLEVKIFGTLQGVTADYTLQLANGFIEASGSVTLIEPTTIETSVTIDIP